MKIGDAAIQYLHSEDGSYCEFKVWWGDPHCLHAVARLSGCYERVKHRRGGHPLNIMQKVLSGLERDGRFAKGYILAGHRQQVLTRVFTLKEEHRQLDLNGGGVGWPGCYTSRR